MTAHAPRPLRRGARAAAVSGAALAVLLAAGCTGRGDDGDSAAPPAAGAPAEQPAASGSTSPSSAAPTQDPSTSVGGTPSEGAAEPEQDADGAGGSASGASVGGIVTGFPTALVPTYPGATVSLTSAAPVGEQLDVTLAGQSGDAADAVVEFYRQALLAAGFAESPGPQGVVGATFTRSAGAEVLTVAVVSAQGQQQFTVGGTVTP